MIVQIDVPDNKADALLNEFEHLDGNDVGMVISDTLCDLWNQLNYALTLKTRPSGTERIATERKRQIEGEGWTVEHDDKHRNGELAMAAACYALTPDWRQKKIGFFTWSSLLLKLWPFHISWYKPTPDNRIRELEKAGALIAAEIDRILGLEVSG